MRETRLWTERLLWEQGRTMAGLGLWMTVCFLVGVSLAAPENWSAASVRGVLFRWRMAEDPALWLIAARGLWRYGSLFMGMGLVSLWRPGRPLLFLFLGREMASWGYALRVLAAVMGEMDARGLFLLTLGKGILLALLLGDWALWLLSQRPAQPFHRELCLRAAHCTGSLFWMLLADVVMVWLK